MAVNIEAFKRISGEAGARGSRLAAVSKTKPVEDILALYGEGQRIFAENYVQELIGKQPGLPDDIQWHFIGHLQRNKVKYLAPFISMIQTVDSLPLLEEINKQAARHNRVIDCLLEVHIAREATKSGLAQRDAQALAERITRDPAAFPHVRLCGLMGMASFTDDLALVRSEFRKLKELCSRIQPFFGGDAGVFRELSMGMSADYSLALEEGSTLIRVGSLLFGSRN